MSKSEKQTEITAPDKEMKKTKTKTPMLRLASWNIRTMCPDPSDDLEKADDSKNSNYQP